MRNPIVAGERVYLRSLEIPDAEAFSEMDAIETDTFMYRGRAPSSPIHEEIALAEAYKAETPGVIEFAVCLTADDRLIGGVELDDIDWVNRTAETGSYLMAGYRNRGYGPEAKHLLLEYAFDRLHLFALSSFVYETNRRSADALAKQGYRPAGRLRRRDVKDGVYGAYLAFDVQRDEWLAAREEWRQSVGSRR